MKRHTSSGAKSTASHAIHSGGTGASSLSHKKTPPTRAGVLNLPPWRRWALIGACIAAVLAGCYGYYFPYARGGHDTAAAAATNANAVGGGSAAIPTAASLPPRTVHQPRAPPPQQKQPPPLPRISAEDADRFYLQHPPSPFPLDSYLLDPEEGGGGGEDAARIADILRAIHAQQHPDPATCATRRLLLVQFDTKSFEGIGSNLKLMSLGLAEAAYSNRTLIWGLDLPYMWEHSRPVWQTSTAAATTTTQLSSSADSDSTATAATSHTVEAAGVPLDCGGWLRAGGGPFGCWFQPLSSCSLADVTAEELVALGGAAGHADTSRVRVQEARRGPVAYIPPPGRFRPAHDAAPSAHRGVAVSAHAHNRVTLAAPIDAAWSRARYAWAAALTAYTFRLKRDVVEAFRARRAASGLQPGSSGGSSKLKLMPGSSSSSARRVEVRGDSSVGAEMDSRGASSKSSSAIGGETGSWDSADRHAAADADAAARATEENSSGWRPPLWSLHVRRGDVSNLADIYGNRRVFNFREYFAELARAARETAVAAEVEVDDDAAAAIASVDGGAVDGETPATAAASRAHDAAAAASLFRARLLLPGTVFLATDAEDAEAALETERGAFESGLLQWPSLTGDDGDGDGSDSASSSAAAANEGGNGARRNSSSSGSNPRLPRFHTLPASARFRTPHGSHTAAAAGGCIGQHCSLQPADVLFYRAAQASSAAQEEAGAGASTSAAALATRGATAPRHDGTAASTPSTRLVQARSLMRVLGESIEDLFLLGGSDVLVTQGSSHFSTFAALLGVARCGGRAANASDAARGRLRSLSATAVAGAAAAVRGRPVDLAAAAAAAATTDGSEHTRMHAETTTTNGAAVAAHGGHVTIYLDEAAIIAGEIQTAYLHGALNRTSAVPRKRGGERWLSHKLRFVEACVADAAPAPWAVGDAAQHAAFGWGGPFRLGSDGLPAMPVPVVDRETPRWLGGGQRPLDADANAAASALLRPQPTARFFDALLARAMDTSLLPREPWSGECPFPRRNSSDGGGAVRTGSGTASELLLAHAVELINHGAQHSEWHPNQAQLCWAAAETLLVECEAAGGARIGQSSLSDIRELLRENIVAGAQRVLAPYTLGRARIAALLALNLGLGNGTAV